MILSASLAPPSLWQYHDLFTILRKRGAKNDVGTGTGTSNVNVLMCYATIQYGDVMILILILILLFLNNGNPSTTPPHLTVVYIHKRFSLCTGTSPHLLIDSSIIKERLLVHTILLGAQSIEVQ